MTVQAMLPGHAAGLAALQQAVFPTLAAADRIRAEQFIRHLQIFPEGQFVLLADDHIVGSTTTMRATFDFDRPHHRFRDISGGGWLTHHEPAGDWLYGLDMMIHPAFRGRGGARLLYRARQQLVRRQQLRGQLIVGMLSGYGSAGRRLTGEQYYREWLDGLRTDPTLTPQRRIGFRPLVLLADYLDDPGCGNYGVLLRLDAWNRV